MADKNRTLHAAVWFGMPLAMARDATQMALLRLAQRRGILTEPEPALWCDTVALGGIVRSVAEAGEVVALEGGGAVAWAFVTDDGLGGFQAVCTPAEKALAGLGDVVPGRAVYAAMRDAAWRGVETTAWASWDEARRAVILPLGHDKITGGAVAPAPVEGRPAVVRNADGRGELGRIGAVAIEDDSTPWIMRPKWQVAWSSLVDRGETLFKSQTAAMWAVVREDKALKKKSKK